MAMNYHKDQLWIGDKTGIVKLFSLCKNFEIELIESFDYGAFEMGKRITGIKYDTGAVYSCGTDGYFRVS